MRKQKEQWDYWDEYEDYSLNLNLDELDYNEFSLNLFSSNNKKVVVIKDGRKKEDMYEGLGDDKGEYY